MTMPRACASRARAARPGAQPLDVHVGEPPGGVQDGLGHGEQRRPGQALLAQHGGEVAADLLHRLRWHAVQHDRHRRAAGGRLAQQLPRHRVGVPGGGGDEQPEVGGRRAAGWPGRGWPGPPSRCRGRPAAPARESAPVEATRCRSPGWSCGAVPVLRARPGRIRAPVNQRSSAGWWTSTGERVVGRSTPLRVTFCPTRELTRVDLPAPVEPPTTASRGASSASSRGMT